MILFVPDHEYFKPHWASMMPLAQDSGFGEIHNSPPDVCEQVCAFTETPLNCHEAMIYLEH